MTESNDQKTDLAENEADTLSDFEPVNPEDPSSADEIVAEDGQAEPEDRAEQLDTDPAAHDDPVVDMVADDEPASEDDDADDDGSEKGDPYGGHSPEALKRILEGALFAAGTALSIAQLAALFEEHERPHRKILRALLTELIARYEGGGFELIEVASGYRFQTRHDAGHWISRLWEERPARYSRALLETLALIAYRQPITRGEIEDVRGVSVSSSIVKTLQEREWVRVVGHRDVPGRPAMYATTRQFLDYFGLRSLDQLPSLGEIRDLDDINPELGLEDQGHDGAGAVDKQAEISFSTMVDKLREGERTGKTGNEFIDEQLDGQLSDMDAVNEAIERSFEAQRAGHNQPGLELADGEDDGGGEYESESEEAGGDVGDVVGEVDDACEIDDEGRARSALLGGDDASGDDEPLSEEDQWKIIQEKLAQQQALLDARENDQPGGEDDENE